MGTQYITAGRGDPVTTPPGTNDPQCFDADAAEQAEQNAIVEIRNNISGKNDWLHKNISQSAKLELADTTIRYLTDIEVIDLINGLLAKDKDAVFSSVEKIIDSSIEALADIKVAEKSYA